MKFYPEIDFKEVSLVFASDYYDGPMAGLCTYKNKIYYFDCWDLDCGGWDSPTPLEMVELRKLVSNKTQEELENFSCDLNDCYVDYDSEEKEFYICRPRKFYVYELTKIQLLLEHIRHFLFNLLVSDNGNYKGHERVPMTYIRSNFIKNIYYFILQRNALTKKYEQTRTRYHMNPIIGWFKW